MCQLNVGGGDHGAHPRQNRVAAFLESRGFHEVRAVGVLLGSYVSKALVLLENLLVGGDTCGLLAVPRLSQIRKVVAAPPAEVRDVQFDVGLAQAGSLLGVKPLEGV